jgi:hypothetical protein
VKLVSEELKNKFYHLRPQLLLDRAREVKGKLKSTEKKSAKSNYKELELRNEKLTISLVRWTKLSRFRRTLKARETTK